MIIRVFHAGIRKGKVSDLNQIIQEQTVPTLKTSDGMLHYYGGASLDEDKREFVMVTLWRDLESLKQFVGDN